MFFFLQHFQVWPLFSQRPKPMNLHPEKHLSIQENIIIDSEKKLRLKLFFYSAEQHYLFFFFVYQHVTSRLELVLENWLI